MVQCYFPKEYSNNPVKNSVNGTHGTMLFSREKGKLRITQSRIKLTAQRVRHHFPSKKENWKDRGEKYRYRYMGYSAIFLGKGNN